MSQPNRSALSTTPSPSPLAAPLPWNLVAEAYVADVMPVLANYSEYAVDLAAPAATASVLDVAAGPGTTTFLLSKRVREVFAIDFSEKMIALLSSRAEREGVANVHARVMNGQRLEFESERFDAAFSMFGLMFFPDRLAGFAELFRVLKPGAKCVVSSWAPVERSPGMQALFGALRAAIPELPTPERSVETLESAEVFMRELRRTGFQRAQIHSVICEMPVVDLSTFWASMTKSSAPIALARQRFTDAEWAERSREAVGFLERHFTRVPCAIASEAYVGIATKPIA